MNEKIDLEKFICSYVKLRNIQDALKEQGLKCRNGEIVKIPQDSEDEMIRKALVKAVSGTLKGNKLFGTNVTREEALVWLEKQGKHKDYYTKQELIDMGFSFTLNGDIVTPDEMMEDMKKYLAWHEKQCEQKSKWTEEDEKCIDNCCLLIGAADDCYEKPFKDDCIHYLQSIKGRIAWKPKWTEEDESKVEDIVYFLDTAKVHYASTKALDDCITWVKSLKQRMEE